MKKHKIIVSIYWVLIVILLVAMVNPFDLNTDNMTKIEPFNLLLPRRVFFKIPEFHQGIKSKLIFNDYMLFFEKNEDA